MTLTALGKINMARDDVRLAMAQRHELRGLRDFLVYANESTPESAAVIAKRIGQLEAVVARALTAPGVAEKFVEESDGVLDALTRLADETGVKQA